MTPVSDARRTTSERARRAPLAAASTAAAAAAKNRRAGHVDGSLRSRLLYCTVLYCPVTPRNTSSSSVYSVYSTHCGVSVYYEVICRNPVCGHSRSASHACTSTRRRLPGQGDLEEDSNSPANLPGFRSQRTNRQSELASQGREEVVGEREARVACASSIRAFFRQIRGRFSAVRMTTKRLLGERFPFGL